MFVKVLIWRYFWSVGLENYYKLIYVKEASEFYLSDYVQFYGVPFVSKLTS